MTRLVGDIEIPSLVDACADPRLLGVELTPVQAQLLEAVEQGDLLHCWALGRRSGKTLLSALIGVYFSVLRPDMQKYVRRREWRYSVAVATNLRQARLFIEAAATIVEGSKFLQGFVESISEDEIQFKGRTRLRAFPCTSRGGRGWAIQCLLLDEAAHMLDTEGNQAAEPIFRALVPSVSQFGEDGRVIVASSPFGIDGFFAELFHQVERGELDGAVTGHASTMEARPGFETAALRLEQQRDPDAFRSEYGAEFVPAGAGFLDPARVVGHRGGELKPGKVDGPIAAIDLAFVQDSTAVVIVGRDKKNRQRLRLVLARSWTPRKGEPLGFGPTLDEIAAICREHGISRLYTDQFSAQAAVEHLARHGIHASKVNISAGAKSEMFASLKTRLYGGEIELYDNDDLLQELRRIETVTTPGAATVRIRRVGTSHGDLASALALACSQMHGSGRPARITVPAHSDVRIPTGRAGRTLADLAREQYSRERVHPGDHELAARLGLPPPNDHHEGS